MVISSSICVSPLHFRAESLLIRLTVGPRNRQSNGRCPLANIANWEQFSVTGLHDGLKSVIRCLHVRRKYFLLS